MYTCTPTHRLIAVACRHLPRLLRLLWQHPARRLRRCYEANARIQWRPSIASSARLGMLALVHVLPVRACATASWLLHHCCCCCRVLLTAAWPFIETGPPGTGQGFWQPGVGGDACGCARTHRRAALAHAFLHAAPAARRRSCQPLPPRPSLLLIPAAAVQQVCRGVVRAVLCGVCRRLHLPRPHRRVPLARHRRHCGDRGCVRAVLLHVLVARAVSVVCVLAAGQIWPDTTVIVQIVGACCAAGLLAAICVAAPLCLRGCVHMCTHRHSCCAHSRCASPAPPSMPAGRRVPLQQR